MGLSAAVPSDGCLNPATPLGLVWVSAPARRTRKA